MILIIPNSQLVTKQRNEASKFLQRASFSRRKRKHSDVTEQLLHVTQVKDFVPHSPSFKILGFVFLSFVFKNHLGFKKNLYN